jgi:hypothetical protein
MISDIFHTNNFLSVQDSNSTVSTSIVNPSKNIELIQQNFHNNKIEKAIQIQNNKPISVLSLENKNESIKIEVETPIATDTKNGALNKINQNISIDDMSLSELKEECRNRKLLVTGNKQKLIDRIKAHINSFSNIKGVKSPDSGVNMDSSPSLISSEFKLKNFISIFN